MRFQKFIIKEEANATIFNMISALSCQPTDDLFKNPKLFETLQSAFEIASPINKGDAFQLWKALGEYSNEELLVEYSRLFIGPFQMVAPPYSSMYLGERTLMSDETLWVINFYNKMGLKFDSDLKDSPDHFSVEAEFLYYMIFNEIKELKEENMEKANYYYESRKEFYYNHFLKWVPQFCNKIEKGTNNDYYRALSSCINKFVEKVNFPVFPKQIKKNNSMA